MMIPGIRRPQMARGRQLAWIGSASVTTDGTSFNFGNFAAPIVGNFLIAVIANTLSTNADSPSVTLGGVGAVTLITNTNMSNPRGIYKFPVQKGTSYAISATFGQTQARAAIGVWIESEFGNWDPGATFTGNTTQVTGTSANTTMDLFKDGYSIYAHTHRNNNATGWSGATERADFNVETSRFAFADKQRIPADVTGNVETVSWSGSVSAANAGFSVGLLG